MCGQKEGSELRNLHSRILDSLPYRLRDIGISFEDVHWVLREGVYQPNGRIEEFPDLIAFLNKCKKQKRNFEAIPIELKTGKKNKTDRSKAIHQLYQGAEFARTLQRSIVEYGLLVTAESENNLEFERIPYSEMEKLCR